jgi:hypothetical protein
MYKLSFILAVSLLLMGRNMQAETPALEDLPLMSSVECFGVTWTFDKEYRVGQFVNGDYYVVGNVTVASISPAATAERNGSVLNIPLDAGKSGFDSRTSGGRFTSSWRANPPVNMKPGDCLISSISIGARGEHKAWLRESDTPVSYVKSVSALTCVAAPVPTDAFRPSYTDRGQKIFLASNLKRHLMPNVPKMPLAPDIKEFADHYRRPWNDICFYNFDAAIEYQPAYGRENGRAAGMASLLLSCDYTAAEKESLLINFVQYGIDLWGMVRNGYRGWPAHGGHGSGRKWPIMFAGLMLGDAAMAAPTKTYPDCRFGEDMQTKYDNCWTGANVVYAGHQGYWKGQVVSSTPGWGLYEHLQPRDWPTTTGGTYIGESYRRCCTSIAWVGQQLSALFFGAKGNWNHDAFFDYCDRWMTEDDMEHLATILAQTGQDFSATRQRTLWDNFVRVMYGYYRNNLPTTAVNEQLAGKDKIRIADLTLDPHPVVDKAVISFNLPDPASVEIKVFNLQGTVIIMLAQEQFGPGEQKVAWDAQGLENGIYYIQIRTAGYQETRELIKLGN